MIESRAYKVKVYRGGGDFYLIGISNVFRITRIANDCDATPSDLNLLCCLEGVTAVIGSRGQALVASKYGYKLKCYVALTEIKPCEARKLIPHFRVGLTDGEDQSLEGSNNVIIFHAASVSGEMVVRFYQTHLRYEFRRVEGDVKVVEDKPQPYGISGDWFHVRGFFEDSKVFSMMWSVEKEQYFANLTTWLMDQYEVGYARS